MKKWRSPFPPRKPPPNLLQRISTELYAQRDHRIMIYDFTHFCNNYDKNFYTNIFFTNTSCPNCRAVGRFKLHGSYGRHVIYFQESELVHDFLEIKRILCLSCKATHAILPGDVVAYKLLSLFVMVSILSRFYLKQIPVLKIAETLQFSFQFIYSCLKSFLSYVNNIHQYFRQVLPNRTPVSPNPIEMLCLICEACILFQHEYIKLNYYPCFIGSKRKLYDCGAGPPVGILAAVGSPKVGNIGFEYLF